MKLLLIKALSTASFVVLVAAPLAQLYAQENQTSESATPDQVVNGVAALKIDGEHCNINLLTNLSNQIATLVEAGQISKPQAAELIIKIDGVAYECEKAKLMAPPPPEEPPT